MTAPSVPAGAPNLYDGWARLAEAVALELPVTSLDGIWVFSKVRHETREFGTAILSRIDGARRRIYTARFSLTIRGSDRGTFTTTIEEVGSGPLSALEELLADVRKRSDDGEPPRPIPVTQWYPDVVPDVAVLDMAPVVDDGPVDDAPVDDAAADDATTQP